MNIAVRCVAPFCVAFFVTSAQAADMRRSWPTEAVPLAAGSTSPKMIPLEEDSVKINYGRTIPKGISWEGFFVGGSVGGAFGDSKWGDVSGHQTTLNQMPGSVQIRGVNFGGQGGYNWQYGPLVAGAELSWRMGSLLGFANNSHSDPNLAAGQVGKVEATMLLNTSVRAGYAAGQNLYLLRAGAAALNLKYTNDFNAPGTTSGTKSGMVYGPSFGVGLERDLGRGFSARLQYDFMTFENKSYTFSDASDRKSTLSMGQNLHMVTAGIDYRFGAIGELSGSASPTINQEITGEIGLRGDYAKSNYAKQFYNATTKTQRDARLDFDGQSFSGVEVFGMLEHDSGIFLKGMMGFGQQMGKGTLRNQDFPPQWDPYSDIRASQKNGRRMTASADLGFQWWRTKDFKAGAFVGAGRINDRLNAYGCRQLATSQSCVDAQPESLINLTDDLTWNVTRVGLRGEAVVFNKLRIVAEGVWNPRFNFTSRDNHWWWVPLPGKGDGNNGVQGEMVVSYDITPELSAGIGGRYTKLSLRKGDVNLAGTMSPARYEYSDTTGFLQLSYRFRSDQQK